MQGEFEGMHPTIAENRLYPLHVSYSRFPESRLQPSYIAIYMSKGNSRSNMKRTMPFRSWFYLRTGYGVYLAFVLAAANTLVTVYYLAIKSIPDLEAVFPSFTIWAIVMLGTGVPLAIYLGWVHVKRSPAWTSELDVQVEANPYNYKLIPGYWKEAFTPLYLQLLRLNLKILDGEKLTPEERKEIQDLSKKLEELIKGGRIGYAGRKNF
jgi:hypothetical protein